MEIGTNKDPTRAEKIVNLIQEINSENGAFKRIKVNTAQQYVPHIVDFMVRNAIP